MIVPLTNGITRDQQERLSTKYKVSRLWFTLVDDDCELELEGRRMNKDSGEVVGFDRFQPKKQNLSKERLDNKKQKQQNKKQNNRVGSVGVAVRHLLFSF